MKRVTWMMVLAVIWISTSLAAPWKVVKQSTAPVDDVERASFIDANTGWIVTNPSSTSSGWVLKTTDGGKTWITVRAADNTKCNWKDMEFINADVGYACGSYGVIYKTVNGGLTWTMVGDTNTYKKDLLDLDVVTPDVVYFAGKSSTLLKTSDGGSTYTAAPTATFNDDLDGGIAFCSPNVGVVAVDNNTNPFTWYTHDGGATWTAVNMATLFPVGLTSKRIYDVAAGGDSTILIASYHHVHFLSKDGGKTYTVSGPYTYNLTYSGFADVIDANTYVAGGGSDGYMVITSDGGNTWTEIKTGTGQSTSAVDFIDVHTGYLFAAYQMWFKTTDGGAFWQPLNTWPGVGFWGLAFPETNRIVATTSFGGEVTISEDGGSTWDYPNNFGTNYEGSLFEIEFVNSTTGFTGGDKGTLLKTTDGGYLWSAPIDNALASGGKAINAMHVVSANPNVIYIAGGNGALAKSTDGGATWSSSLLTSGTTKTIYDIFAIAENQVVLVAGTGEYCVSTDGTTFTKVGAVAGTPNLRAVEFRNGVGIIPAQAGKVFRTTSWDVLPTLVYTDPSGAELYDVEFIDDNTAYIVGQYGVILKTTDAGLTWTKEDSPVNVVLQKVKYNAATGKLWAVGQNGVILSKTIVPTPNVTITFLANTASVPDTLQPWHTVQIRGFAPFTWDHTSPGIMSNIDGDYWTYTIELPRSSLSSPIEYKFCTFPVSPLSLTGEMNGWEAGGNRVLDLTTFEESDTTLPLQFVRGLSGDLGQFAAPYRETDSIEVYLRVNMEALVKAQAFNPETEFVGVRGSNAWGDWSGTPDFNWGSTHRFTQEPNHANGIWGSTYNGTYFWNGVLHLPPEWAGKEIQYKFLIGDAWGRDESANRSLILPADGSDVTVHWVWFNNVPPAGFTGKDTADITFYADLTKAIANNGFEVGDTLLVKYGYFGSSVEVKTATMVRQTGTQNYFVTVEDVPLAFGKPLYYQYYLVKGGQEQREVYFNFDYTGSVPSEAERRAFVVESATPLIADIVDSDVDARRMPVFRNNKLLARPVAVTVECDIRPAIYQVKAGSTLDDIQSSFDITPEMLTADPDTIFKLGVFINGPMSNNGEGTWVTWGGTLAADPNRKMWDDGTHGDAVAGDSIFTVVYNFDPALGHRVGQEFKFGIGGGDNESGYGLNHIENINDANATYVMHNQWGSINPKFYSAWNFDLHRPATAVREEGIPVVTRYALEQNYPNPFNPTTQIRFALPEAGDVQLTIYNMLGQVVNRVVFNGLNMGVYSYNWDGKDLRGNAVASGVYFYEMRVGNKFRDLKKMILMK